MPAVHVDEVRKLYGDPPGQVTALDGVSFDIEQGEIFGLLGPNGAGKTTLIKILSTLVRPTSGTARVAGVDVTQDPAGVRERIGLVFQEPSLDNLLSGRENLELSAALYSVPRKQAAGRIDELLDMMDLSRRGDDPVKQYSGGMKRRLEIARGLLHRPEVLFLDEPTLGLDPQSRERLWEYIKGLREQGTTVLLTTHYMDEADELCDRIAIIDHGQIEALDAPDTLKARLGETVVHVRGPTIETLEERPEVAEIEVLEGDEGYLVQLSEGVQGLPAFLRALEGLQHVEVRTTTLQDVFLSVTGRELREEGGEGGTMADMQRYQQAGGEL